VLLYSIGLENAIIPIGQQHIKTDSLKQKVFFYIRVGHAQCGAQHT